VLINTIQVDLYILITCLIQNTSKSRKGDFDKLCSYLLVDTVKY